MKPIRSNKKAFTLVELCIVMALVSIVALLMTSFMAVFQPRVAQNQARHDFLDEVSLVREELRKWVTNADNGTVYVGEGNGYLLYRKTDDEAPISDYVDFSDGTLSFEYSSDKVADRDLSLSIIKAIEFEIYAPDSAPQPSNYARILECTIFGVDVYGKSFSQSMYFSLSSSSGKFAPVSAPTDE